MKQGVGAWVSYFAWDTGAVKPEGKTGDVANHTVKVKTGQAAPAACTNAPVERGDGGYEVLLTDAEMSGVPVQVIPVSSTTAVVCPPVTVYPEATTPGDVLTVANTISGKTTNLPANPAAVSDIPTAAATAAATNAELLDDFAAIPAAVQAGLVADFAAIPAAVQAGLLADFAAIPAAVQAALLAVADSFKASTAGMALEASVVDLRNRLREAIDTLTELQGAVVGTVPISPMDGLLTSSDLSVVASTVTSDPLYGYASAQLIFDIANAVNQYGELAIPEDRAADLSECSHLRFSVQHTGAGTWLELHLSEDGVTFTTLPVALPDGSQGKRIQASVNITSMVSRSAVRYFRWVQVSTSVDVNTAPGHQDWFGSGQTTVELLIDKLEGVKSGGGIPALDVLLANADAFKASTVGLATGAEIDAVSRLWRRPYDMARVLTDYALNKVLIDDFNEAWTSSDDAVLNVQAEYGDRFHGATAMLAVAELLTAPGTYLERTFASGTEVDLSRCGNLALVLESSVAGTAFLRLGLRQKGSTFTYFNVSVADGDQDMLHTVTIGITSMVYRDAIDAVRLEWMHSAVDVSAAPGDQWPGAWGITHANVHFDRLEGLVTIAAVPAGDWA